MPVLDSDRIVAALRGAFAREEGREGVLRVAAEKIRAAGPPYTSVYLYMLHENELVLEAHAGRDTDHTRIPVGVGVCGTAVASGQDQNVPARLPERRQPGVVGGAGGEHRRRPHAAAG